MAPTLKDIFGSDELANQVEKFDFDKNERGMIISYAPLYGNFTKQSFEAMSDEVKILIAVVTKTMQKIEPQDRNYDTITTAFMQSPLLQLDDQKSIQRSDAYHTDHTNLLKLDGSPDPKIVQEIHHWFDGLVQDQEVLQKVGLGVDALAKVVAQSGAKVDGVESAIHKEEFHQKLFQVTFLDFPDPDRPLFDIHRLALEVWSSSDRTGFLQKDQNGVTGAYTARAFTYRSDVLQGLSELARNKAIAIANGLFD
ncbi:hypothetical protein LTR84_005694 [Exophiala bonariae]|uniref:Uncharacterized protein n=1 Tax=Exophiala bonariae TaxID=1690606 RepID=A0AAV9N333_9EURO|nr:hypothetical protein LTR84_005694 [Exophiala bonariae]